MKKITLSLAFAAFMLGAQAQEGLKLPAPSPTQVLKQDFSISTVEITYSRPSAKGRKVFGDLVPMGSVWRTGANSATKIKFGEDVNMGGQKVPAGEYSLYTIPGEKSWEVILNKNTGNWGANGYDQKDDVARFKVTPASTSNTVQTFTIGIENITINSFELELSWEKTKVSIPVKSLSNENILSYIKESLNAPADKATWQSYQQSANYLLETNQDMELALQLSDKAIALKKDAFWLHNLKARIAQKMNKKEIAIEAAKQSIELSKGTGYEKDNTKNNEAIIKSFK